MIKLSFLLLILVTLNVKAQDVLKVVVPLRSSINSLDSLNKQDSKIKSLCESTPSQSEINSATVHCECEDKKLDADQFKTFQISDIKKESLPKEIKSFLPGQALENGDGNIKVVVSLPNDNKMLGLWGVFFGNDGDDMGATHGSALSIAKTFKNGFTYKLKGETNLYTKRSAYFNRKDGDTTIVPQYFTNENLLNFTIDNIHKNKVMYWKAGVGWIQLDSKNSKGLIQASAQQHKWHKLLNTYNFDYDWDGSEVQRGVNIESFFGLQKNLLFGSSCRVRFYGESGAHISSLDDDYFKVEAGSMLYFQKPDKAKGFNLGASGDMKAHKDGIQFKSDLSVGYRTKKAGAEFIYHVKGGELRNHVNYNLPNEDTGLIDPTVSMKFSFILGGGQKKKKK